MQRSLIKAEKKLGNEFIVEITGVKKKSGTVTSSAKQAAHRVIYDQLSTFSCISFLQ